MPIKSNLNLNGSTPPRARPNLGEWGPAGIVTTRKKKRRRWLAILALFLSSLACFLLGWYVYYAMTGRIGFGFDGPDPAP